MTGLDLFHGQVWEQAGLLWDKNHLRKADRILGAADEQDWDVDSVALFWNLSLNVPIVISMHCFIPIQRTLKSISFHTSDERLSEARLLGVILERLSLAGLEIFLKCSLWSCISWIYF